MILAGGRVFTRAIDEAICRLSLPRPRTRLLAPRDSDRIAQTNSTGSFLVFPTLFVNEAIWCISIAAGQVRVIVALAWNIAVVTVRLGNDQRALMIMSRMEGSMKGTVNAAGAGSRGRKDPLLSTSSPPADSGPACSTVSTDGQIHPAVIVEMAPGAVSPTSRSALAAESLTGRSYIASTDHAPPVTARALQVLELSRVVNNAKLRHDINFDPHLHFRPNPDARRGERKRREAEAYWTALGHDLEHCALLGRQSPQEAPIVPPRIQRVLAEIRDILQTLVPERDLPVLNDALDLPLLVQQISRATLDYEKLALWLSGVLKSHCAPMRDGWVDDMLGQFQTAARAEDQTSLVDGIRMLFGILEAMRLVGGNHLVLSLSFFFFKKYFIGHAKK